jgi:hypothetical protein
MVVVVAILVGWILLSVPVALVVGRVLRRATELPQTPAAPARGSAIPGAPPQQRGGRAA